MTLDDFNILCSLEPSGLTNHDQVKQINRACASFLLEEQETEQQQKQQQQH